MSIQDPAWLPALLNLFNEIRSDTPEKRRKRLVDFICNLLLESDAKHAQELESYLNNNTKSIYQRGVTDGMRVAIDGMRIDKPPYIDCMHDDKGLCRCNVTRDAINRVMEALEQKRQAMIRSRF